MSKIRMSGVKASLKGLREERSRQRDLKVYSWGVGHL